MGAGCQWARPPVRGFIRISSLQRSAVAAIDLFWGRDFLQHVPIIYLFARLIYHQFVWQLFKIPCIAVYTSSTQQ